MKLYVKQKVFSFRDSFTVKDEFGNTDTTSSETSSLFQKRCISTGQTVKKP